MKQTIELGRIELMVGHNSADFLVDKPLWRQIIQDTVDMCQHNLILTHGCCRGGQLWVPTSPAAFVAVGKPFVTQLKLGRGPSKYCD